MFELRLRTSHFRYEMVLLPGCVVETRIPLRSIYVRCFEVTGAQ